MAWRANLSRNLKELRFLYCQTSPESALTREFVHRNYKDFKTLNPKFPILIRESSGVRPQVWARYEKGKVTSSNYKGKDSQPAVKSLMHSFASASLMVAKSITEVNKLQIDMGIERYVNLDDLKNEAEITAAVQALVRAADDFKV